MRTERRPSQKLPLVRLHTHRLTTVATAFGDGRFKYPGVAALQRALFALLESDRFHPRIVQATRQPFTPCCHSRDLLAYAPPRFGESKPCNRINIYQI